MQTACHAGHAPCPRRHVLPGTTFPACQSAPPASSDIFSHQNSQAAQFRHVEVPIITFSDCEGGGDVFALSPPQAQSRGEIASGPPSSEAGRPTFFGGPAFATVSAQLHLEALSASFPRVYTLGPAFRAERSQTARHLAEFWMLEAEIAFVETLDEVMDVVENLVKSVITGVCSSLDHPGPGWKIPAMRQNHPTLDSATVATPWTRITYTHAVDLVNNAKTAAPVPLQWGDALSSEHEKWLAGSHFQGPVFVTDFPMTLKPFYMRPSSAIQGSAACFDLLVPGIGELAGGSLREERLSNLSEALEAKGLARAHYEWYLDLRRFGSVPHGGFGLGWDRLVSWITGLENIRDCIAFPRAFKTPQGA